MEAYVSYYLHLRVDDMDEDELIKNYERVRYVLHSTGQLKFTD
jgi:hypothetical protein